MGYVTRGYWQGGYTDWETPPAGRGKRSRRKTLTVEIDGEEFSVESISEAQALLDLARKEAEAKAKQAIERTNAALNRPTRKVLKDAEKALVIPEIVVPAEVKDYADHVLAQMKDLYTSTLKDIEISILLRKVEIEQQDEEDILLLLI